MPELLTPGVIIQEVDFGPQPIEGVSTTTTGFVGEAERGPVSGPPTLVTSFEDYQRKFGGFVAGKPLAYAVRGFFDNGGRRAFISRVAGADASPAELDLTSGYDVQLLSSAGAHAQDEIITVRVGSVVGVSPSDTVTFINQVGATVVQATVEAAGVNVAAGTLKVKLAGAIAGLSPTLHAVRYAPPDATERVAFAAASPGTYGRRLQVRLLPVYLTSTFVLAEPVGTDVVLANVDGLAAGQVLELEDAAGAKEYSTVTAVNVATRTVSVNALSLTLAADDPVRLTGWQLEVFFDGDLVETIAGISSNNADPVNGLAAKVNGSSGWVKVTGTPTLAISRITEVTPTYALCVAGLPTFFDQATGADGTATDNNFIGTDVPPRTGLRAIEAQAGVSLIAVPGKTSTAVVSELVAQAERKMDRFAVFESNDSADPINVLAMRAFFNSKYAAMYHPWVEVLDPLTGKPKIVPPSGHVLGAYARTDNERGVFKAPANVVLRGITGFSHTIPDGEQDILNPAGVNVLRRQDGLGNVIWGARTISAEGLWKYVSVRRLFIYLEQAIIRGTRYAVFEPNDMRLWARLRDSVTNFLTTEWRSGALFGKTAAEAFFVKVDETTTTQDDRDNGRVNILVGIAPVKPAEFIIFNIGQAPSGIIIGEQG